MRAAQTVAILPPTGLLGRSSCAAAVSWLDCSSWPQISGGTVLRGPLLRARKRIVPTSLAVGECVRVGRRAASVPR